MICPSCQTVQGVTEQNYGALYTCQSCQAVYFINFDGQPEFGNDEALAESSPTIADDFVSETEKLQNQINESMQPIVEFNQNEFSADVSPFQNLYTEPAANEMQTFKEVAQDIADYGNTESQIADLNYDLRISGLDTAEIISLFKEAIDDSRFGWDSNEFMRNIKRGEIIFEKLNPVKAYILAKRLQFLDVEKVWKQHAV